MASRSLGTLTLDLIAKIGGFEQGMNQAARIADKRMKDIGNSARSMSELFNLRLLKEVGEKLKGIVTETINTADRLNELAQMTGLSVTQLQAVGNVAAKSGSNIEDFSTALAKFNKATAEAAGGSKDQAAVFDALGVSLKDAQGNLRPVAAVLDDVARKLSTYRDDQNKTAIEMALFGRSGAQLTAALNSLGSEGIDSVIERMRRMNTLIAEDLIKSSDAFNDKMVDAQATITVFKSKIAEGMLPVLTQMVSEFNDAKGKTDAMDKALRAGNVGAKILASAFILLKESAAGFGTLLGNQVAVLTKAFEGITAVDLLIPGKAAFKVLKNLDDAADVAGEGIEDFVHRSTRSLGELNRVWDQTGENFSPEEGLQHAIAGGGLLEIKDPDAPSAPNIEANKQAAKEAGDALKKLQDQQRDAIKSLEEFDTALLQQAETFDKSETELITYKLQTGDLAQKLKDAGKGAEGFFERITAHAAFAEATKNVKAFADSIEGLDQQIAELRGDSVEAALKAFDIANKDALKKIQQAKELAEAAKSNPLLTPDQRSVIEQAASEARANEDRIASVRSLVGANAELNRILNDGNKRRDEEALAEDRINAAQQAGALGEIGAITQLQSLRERRLEELYAEEAAVQSIIDKKGHLPELDAALLDIQKQEVELMGQTDLLAQKINSFFVDNFADAFASIIEGTSSVKDAFRDMGEAIIKELIRIAAQNMALAVFGGGGSGGIGGFLGGLFGIFGGGMGSTAPAVGGSGFGASLGGFDLGAGALHYGAGGDPPIGRWSVVGEHGPELFKPRVAGTIIPNDQLMGQKNNLSIQLIEDSSRAGRVIRRNDGQKDIVKIIVNDIRGGGDISKALEQTYASRRIGQ